MPCILYGIGYTSLSRHYIDPTCRYVSPQVHISAHCFTCIDVSLVNSLTRCIQPSPHAHTTSVLSTRYRDSPIITIPRTYLAVLSRLWHGAKTLKVPMLSATLSPERWSASAMAQGRAHPGLRLQWATRTCRNL